MNLGEECDAGGRGMLKHRGFPGRLPGTDLQFTIRRADPRGVTPLKARERYADRRPIDRAADAAFLAALWEHFGAEPFERGNLDAGRLGWLLGREVVPAEEPSIRRATRRCSGSTRSGRGELSGGLRR